MSIKKKPKESYEEKVVRMLEEGKKRRESEVVELRQKNAELEIKLKAMRGAANGYKAEVERLNEKINQKDALNQILQMDLGSVLDEKNALEERRKLYKQC